LRQARALTNETIISIINRGKPKEIKLPVYHLDLPQKAAKSFFSGNIFKIESGYIILELKKGAELLIF